MVNLANVDGIACPRFVQNAWKKDMCSNCFKSREDHANTKNADKKLTCWKASLQNSPKHGILKSASIGKNRLQNVSFNNNESEIIGFGGEDYSSEEECYFAEDEESISSSNNLSNNKHNDTDEEDKEFQKLTRFNTDFNSIPSNLQCPVDDDDSEKLSPAKNFTNLKLGKPLIDENGCKQTLQVSVEPFKDSAASLLAASRKLHLSKLLQEFDNDVDNNNNNHDHASIDSMDSKFNDTCDEFIDSNGVVGSLEEKSIDTIDLNMKINNGLCLSANECSKPIDCSIDSEYNSNEKMISNIDNLDKLISTKVADENIEVKQEDSCFDEKNQEEEINETKKCDENEETVEKQINETTNKENIYLKNGGKSMSKTNNNNNYCKEIMRDNSNKLRIKDHVHRRQILPPRNIDSNQEGNNSNNNNNNYYCSNEIKENIKTAKSKLEPLFKLGFSTRINNNNNNYKTYSQLDSSDFRSGFYVGGLENDEKINNNNNDGKLDDDRVSNSKMVCNILNLPLITGESFLNEPMAKNFLNESVTKDFLIIESDVKDLSLEIDQPGSRELVGEPDGKADSDDHSDPPSLKNNSNQSNNEQLIIKSTNFLISPNPQKSFLHDFSKEKPKIATKPTTLLQNFAKSTAKSLISINKHLNSDVSKIENQVTLHTDSPSSDVSRSTKRPAPKPPIPTSPSPSRASFSSDCSTPEKGNLAENVYEPADCFAKNHDAPKFGNFNLNTKSNFRNSEYYEKSNIIISNNSSCELGKNFSNDRNLNNGSYRQKNLDDNYYYCEKGEHDCITDDGYSTPKSVEKTVHSMSAVNLDSLVAIPVENSGSCFSEKNRRYNGAATKVRYTIRKILRLNATANNNNSGINKSAVAAADECSDIVVTPNVTPRKRLEIIHPLDLNKSAVEVVGKNNISVINGLNIDHDLFRKKPSQQAEFDNYHRRTSSPIAPPVLHTARPNKPPPPPRSQSLDLSVCKPMRPPLPKPNHLIQKQLIHCTNLNPFDHKTSEPIGESIRQQNVNAPVKPQRCSSIRERNKTSTTPNSSQSDSTEHLCMQIDSEISPECDRNTNNDDHEIHSSIIQIQSNGQLVNSSSSIAYCGSETESNISYKSAIQTPVTSDDSVDDELETCANEDPLKMRKRRSVLHNSLEDNYGAVVIANHEALSQLLERVNHTVIISSCLKSVHSSPKKLRWHDFHVFDHSKVTVSDWIYYNGKWNNVPVIVSLSLKHKMPVKSLPIWITLTAIAEFTDTVPSKYIKSNDTDETVIQAYITVWNEEEIQSLESYSAQQERNSSKNNEDVVQAGLITVQLMNALKCLQACGIEETYLHEFIICWTENKSTPKLRILPTTNIDSRATGNELLSLCKCASRTLNILLPSHRITDIVQKLLSDERAMSLSQAKSVIEYWLWGPTEDVALSQDRLVVLQRWLDLERATLLHKLVCSKSLQLSWPEQCHLMFLVRTNSKALADASCLLEHQNF